MFGCTLTGRASALVGVFVFALALGLALTARPAAAELRVGVKPGELGSLVNPFAGTGGAPYVCAYNTPAATAPFGLVRLGPDTMSNMPGKKLLNGAGYYYGDKRLIGFSHTRLVGAFDEEGGHFRVFPTRASRGKAVLHKKRYTPFSHKEEAAFAGYYAVRLPKENVLVELTATPRVGVHRYTFAGDDGARILVDVTSVLGQHRSEDGAVRVIPEARELEGSVRTFGTAAGRYGGLAVFFVARFSRPFTSYGVWTGSSFRPGKAEARGEEVGVDLAFGGQADGLVVELRLAVSCVSIENARANLQAEAAGRSFEELFGKARDAWERRLSLIRVQGGTRRQQRIFYTALYRAFQMPTEFNDANGDYRGFDKAVHHAEGFLYYTDLSLWDTFRTVHPLYNLVARAEQRDMIVSLIEMAKAGGCLPRWPAGCGYTNCMMGTPADILISEAYQKGIRDFDVQAAYGFMRQTALEGVPKGSRFAGRKGLKSYIALGYCPSDEMSKAVSRTLEFAHADYALSLLARRLGREEDAALFARHACSYRNLWNSETQYFQPRDSKGNFTRDFRPLLLTYADFTGKYTDDYVEGSALQWRWSVPFDPEGLISLFKSREYFVSELNDFFAESTSGMGALHPGSYYWHGNEHDIHAAYLFNTAGRPDLTQKWVRWILENRYEDNPMGLDGNDDGGTLSAWYVLSALGFYPIAGTDRYELGAPLFAKADVRMGKTVLRIVAANHGPENVRVKRARLNGTALNRTWFTHGEIADGATLEFEMMP